MEATEAQTEHLLYSFAGNPDGAGPYASLVRHSGVFYGTTFSGGKFGYGTVFKVTTTGKETVLHSFSGGADESSPYGSLVFDKLGNLYGTTSGGGTFNSGTVFFRASSAPPQPDMQSLPRSFDSHIPWGVAAFCLSWNH